MRRRQLGRACADGHGPSGPLRSGGSGDPWANEGDDRFSNAIRKPPAHRDAGFCTQVPGAPKPHTSDHHGPRSAVEHLVIEPAPGG